jgi:hypothetical protein
MIEMRRRGLEDDSVSGHEILQVANSEIQLLNSAADRT